MDRLCREYYPTQFYDTICDIAVPQMLWGDRSKCILRIIDHRYLYIIHNIELDTYKIGISKDPHHRISVLENQSGCKLSFVFLKLLDNARQCEAFAHKIAPCRVKGEWFKCHRYEAIGAVTDAIEFFDTHYPPSEAPIKK